MAFEKGVKKIRFFCAGKPGRNSTPLTNHIRRVLTQTESRADPEFGHLHEDGGHIVPAGRVPDQCETIATERRRLADVQPLNTHAPAFQHKMSVRVAGVAIVVCKDKKSVRTRGPVRRRCVYL